MTKSELIDRLVRKNHQLPSRDVEMAVKLMIDHLSETLARGDRIEIRGFGSFALHHRRPRIARNPKTGELISLTDRYVPRFKPGKELRDRVNEKSSSEVAFDREHHGSGGAIGYDREHDSGGGAVGYDRERDSGGGDVGYDRERDSGGGDVGYDREHDNNSGGVAPDR